MTDKKAIYTTPDFTGIILILRKITREIQVGLSQALSSE